MSFNNFCGKVGFFLLGAFALALQAIQPVYAAKTDIANAPLFTSSVTSVKSNIMFLFDDSGSMAWDYLPDDAPQAPSWNNNEKYGYYSSQCNGVAYNPSITYVVPIKANGTSSYPAATFTAAEKNGFATGDTTNLTDAYYYKYTGVQPALSYAYSASSTLDKTTSFYQECNSNIGYTPGSSKFQKVILTTSSAEKQNYANWYSYYRTRVLMMKSSVGLAFATVDSKYRVGFNVTGNKSVAGTNFLDIKDFDASQKGDFYTRIYGLDTPSWTPLRGALSRAGQYFANKAPGQTSDPVQYSCQKNFTILSTDGYWNDNGETTSDTKYGPYQLDNNTRVGQQDGDALRPMYDGGGRNYKTRTSSLQSSTNNLQLQSRTGSLQSRNTSDVSAPSIQRRTSSNSGDSWTDWNDVTSCSPDNRGSNRVSCRVPKSTSSNRGVTWTPWFYDGSCSADSNGDNRTKCSGTVSTIGNWSNVTSCTASDSTECKYAWTGWTNIGACTAQPASPASPYTVNNAMECQTVVASVSSWQNTASCVESSTSNCQYTDWSSWSNTSSCTALARSSSPNYTVGLASECQSSDTGGSTDSLADVAMYYYKTDLRNSSLTNCTGALGTSVCDNNVAGGGRDIGTHQHMTTFTLGLGNSGTLKYDPNYLSQSSGDYVDISQGTKNWPVPDGGASNIDDLWHTAVNGRGQFFSASEPSALTIGLNNALDSIKAITGSASAAATSSLQPVQGNNDIYVAQFTSAKWTGDVLSYKIEPSTGVVSPTATWSAQTQLDATSPVDRKIYYSKSGALRNFTYANLTADSLQGNFDNFCSKLGAGATTSPTQCTLPNAANNAIANSGSNLVSYLRGTQTHADDAVYRSREHVLGDVINAAPLFIGKPSFKYAENGYGSFKSGSTRTPVIYMAANDGMLHAFDHATGNEKWAYIPSFVMPNMYKLGDKNYANNHVFMVDGSPVMGDIYINSAWKTIIIGGLNSGGRGYYALDVTDPEAPKMLWEFSETDLGQTFGNPIITKKSDGKWVVIFSSGYNNVSPGDGNGHLYVLDANTGVQLNKFNTDVSGFAVGSTDTPSGLSKINNYVESDVDNTTKVVYGGDLLGNVWRFDINSTVQPYLSAMRLAELKIGAKPQPITSKPALADVSYNGVKYKVVYVGTGRYLGTSDLANTDKQTIYALKDTWSETGLGNVRTATSPAMVEQIATAATSASQGNIVTGTAKPVNWTTDFGWYMDLIASGERVNINPTLVLNALYVGTNVPQTDACTVGGTSWLYKLDIAKGSAIPGASEQAVAVSLGNVLIMGMSNIQLTTKKVATIVTRSDGTLRTVIGSQPSSAGPKRRTSWRILK
jgi:type IV pilus assembly protein PilY1